MSHQKSTTQHRADRDAALLQHQLYDCRLVVGYTLDLAALGAFTPASEQLEAVLSDYPEVMELLGIQGWEEINTRTGWLVGASRPQRRGGLSPLNWFYAPTYQGAMDAAMQWARSGEFEEVAA